MRHNVLEPLLRDLRHSWRALLRTPRFSAVVVSTLALAIGATGAIFAVVNAVVFRPLPYPASHQLLQISQQSGTNPRPLSVSPPNFFDLAGDARSFAALMPYSSGSVTMRGDGGVPERLRAMFAGEGLGVVSGVQPALGRMFAIADDQPGAARVAILSDALWARRFGRDAAILGRTVTIDDAPASVVGVMPAEFSFPEPSIDLWMPMRLSRTTPANPAVPPSRYRDYRVLSVIGRLRPGVSESDARGETASIGKTLSLRYPASNREMTFVAVPLKDAVVSSVRRAMLLFLAGVACLWLVACANVATLLAVRTASRERDIVLRVALGAGRGAIVRQMLIESLMLGLAGGLAGLAVARSALRGIVALAPPDVPRLADARIDLAVVGVTLGLAVVSALLFSLAPVWQSSKRQLAAGLKTGGRSSDAPRHQRVRHVLIVAEMALSVMLLSTAALLAQTTGALGRVEKGFDDSAAFRVDRLELAQSTPAGGSAAFYQRVEALVAATPGVTAVGETLAVPLDPQGRFYLDDTPFDVDGPARSSGEVRPEARLQVVSGGFFGALRIPLIAGRYFDSHDQATSAPVVVINQALADRYFPKGDAVGKWITHELSLMPGQPTHRQIIGVAANLRQFNLDEPYEPQLFLPHTQMPWPAMALVVRSTMAEAQITSAVQSAVWSIDPNLPVPPAAPLSRALRDALGQPRLRSTLIAAVAVTALILAIVGLYGVIAFGVEQRRRDIAIRLMLGASASLTRARVVRDGVLLSTIGGVIGLIASLLIGRTLSSLLFGVSAADPVTGLGVAGVLVAVTAATSYVAARKISAIDPIRTMTE